MYTTHSYLPCSLFFNERILPCTIEIEGTSNYNLCAWRWWRLQNIRYVSISSVFYPPEINTNTIKIMCL